MKRILAIGVILLFIGSISSSTGFNLEKESTIPPLDGKTLYVGGSGPGNYTKIQDAIDNASDGDIVFVFDDSGPFYEYNISISTSISLIGEDRDTTIINGLDRGNIIIINNTRYVNISGFTIRNSTYSYWRGSGVLIEDSGNCNISGNNIFYSNRAGIHIPTKCNNLSIIGNNITHNTKGILHDIGMDHGKLKNCIIKNNIITKNKFTGIWLDFPVDSYIIGNTITHNKDGIHFWFSGGYNTTVTSNIISNNNEGIKIFGFEKQSNNILYNTISHNNIGIHIDDSQGNQIKYNNFIGNIIDNIYESDFTLFIKLHNKWSNNYYRGWISFIPKPIIGLKWIKIIVPNDNGAIKFVDIPIPWLPLFDRNPAQEPYDIEV